MIIALSEVRGEFTHICIDNTAHKHSTVRSERTHYTHVKINTSTFLTPTSLTSSRSCVNTRPCVKQLCINNNVQHQVSGMDTILD